MNIEDLKKTIKEMLEEINDENKIKSIYNLILLYFCK